MDNREVAKGSMGYRFGKLARKFSFIGSTGIRLCVAGILFGAGAFVFANGWQDNNYEVANFAGQRCYVLSGCLHQEWIGLGAGIIMVAIIWIIRDMRGQ